MATSHANLPGSQSIPKFQDGVRFPLIPSSPPSVALPALRAPSQETIMSRDEGMGEGGTRIETVPEDDLPTRLDRPNTRTSDQQAEILSSVRSLGEWVERDISARQADLRAVLDRMDRLADQINRLNGRLDKVGSGDNDRTSPDPSSPIDSIRRNSVAFNLPIQSATEAIPQLRQRFALAPPSPSDNHASYQGSTHSQNNQLIRRPINTEPLPRIIISDPQESLRPFPAPIHPFVSVNPFHVRLRPSHREEAPSKGDYQDTSGFGLGKTSHSLPVPVTSSSPTPHLSHAVVKLCIDTIPRQIYLHLLLRLPSLYFTRVTRIFENAELSMPEIKAMASQVQWKRRRDADAMTWTGGKAGSHSALADFKRDWESFIRSLVKEWKTLNIVSALLLSAILTILQVPNTATDPVTRTAALLSLVCALMSLLYGCIYIVRFGTMKRMHKAASWAVESQKKKTDILWNVWVLLAMPAIWLSWSIILFVACILAFIWRTGTAYDLSNSAPLSPHSALGPRVAITATLSLGMVYFIMIVKTLHRYGSSMDRDWRQKVIEWTKENYRLRVEAWCRDAPATALSSLNVSPAEVQSEQVYNIPPPCFSRTVSPGAPCPSFTAFKFVPDMDLVSSRVPGMPQLLADHDVRKEHWEMYIHDVSLAWAENFRVSTNAGVKNRRDAVIVLVNLWNAAYFLPRAVEVVFCLELYSGHSETNPGASYDHRQPINQHVRIENSPSSYDWAKDRGKFALYLTYAPKGQPRRILEVASGSGGVIPEWLDSVQVPTNIQLIRPLTGKCGRVSRDDNSSVNSGEDEEQSGAEGSSEGVVEPSIE